MDKMKELISLSKKLISMKTTSDRPEELKKCIDFIESYFKKYKKKVYITKYMYNNKPSIVITTRKTKKPDIMFNGHIDVVDSPDYKLIVKKDRLVGRGTCDMKTAVASMMITFKNNLDKDLGLMINSDEEVGGFDGVKRLVKKGWKPKIVVIPDGGDNLKTIVNEEKGVLHIQLEATGKTAHGSRPWLGDNAIEKILSDWERIKPLFNNKKSAWAMTGSLNVFQAGNAINKIPDYAAAKIDIRFPAGKTVDQVFGMIKKKIKKCKVTAKSKGNSLYTDPKNPYVQKLAGIMKKVTGKKVSFSRETGASDGRYFSERGIPVILFMPDAGRTQHMTPEWVSLKELEQFHEILDLFVKAN